MTTIYPVIMCGGAGTRLWPLSRKSGPKQFQKIVTDRSMLGETIARHRAAKDLNIANPSFVCALHHGAMVEAQLEIENMSAERLILEPCPRNTAAVAAAVALEFETLDPNGLILLLPADHHIDLPEDFWTAIAKGIPTAKAGALTTFGIKASRPDIGYGYIKAGPAVGDQTVKVERFVEKPDETTAKSYLESGDYYWNAGIFLFSPAAMVKACKQHSEDILQDVKAAMSEGRREGHNLYLDPARFAECRSESIDYAIMEAAENVTMVCPVDIGWSDIGSWEAVSERPQPESDEILTLDCEGCYIRTDGPLVAGIGLKDIIVIATHDSILITQKDQSQNVKQIVAELKKRGREDLL